MVGRERRVTHVRPALHIACCHDHAWPEHVIIKEGRSERIGSVLSRNLGGRVNGGCRIVDRSRVSDRLTRSTRSSDRLVQTVAFLWQPSLNPLKPPNKPQCFLGAQVGSQTGAGAGQGAGAHTATAQGAGAQVHFFLWQASALPARTNDPTSPLRTKVSRCLFIDASPGTRLRETSVRRLTLRQSLVVNHGCARKVG